MPQSLDTALADARTELSLAFDGEFMQPEIVHGDWHSIDGNMGIEVFPAEYFSLEEAQENYSSGDIWEAETVTGYGARLSAPGYMDCTEWSVFALESDAIGYLIDNYTD